MTAWSENELGRFGTATEIEIAAIRPDGRTRASRTIWIVRAGGDLYVRAAYGAGSRWHQIAEASGRAQISVSNTTQDVEVEKADPAVLDQVDAAYRQKYGGRYASIVDSINATEPRASTLRLSPIEQA